MIQTSTARIPKQTTLPQSLSIRLGTQLDSLAFALQGASRDALRNRPASGKWSAHENLAHLVQHHVATMARIQRILAEDRPQLPSYKAESDPEWPAIAELSTDEVLERLHTRRKVLIDLVSGLGPAQMARIGVHPAFGEMTIMQWLDFFLLHEAHHLYVIISRARGKD